MACLILGPSSRLTICRYWPFWLRNCLHNMIARYYWVFGLYQCSQVETRQNELLACTIIVNHEWGCIFFTVLFILKKKRHWKWASETMFKFLVWNCVEKYFTYISICCQGSNPIFFLFSFSNVLTEWWCLNFINFIFDLVKLPQ